MSVCSTSIKSVLIIDPKHIKIREITRHWKGDFVIVKGKNKPREIVEDKSRYTLIFKVKIGPDN